MKKNQKKQGPQPGDDGLELSRELQENLMERCKSDVTFWIDNYCHTFDPRVREPNLQFKLYPYQKELAQQLVNQIRRGEDLLIEKSRDMGVTWLALAVFQWFWLFEPGSLFLLGSRKLDYVDRLGDMSTLFERIRYNLYLLPEWMLPEGFQKRFHDHKLKLVNPVNGSCIVGESSNPNFARGGRFKAILMDEFAYWQNDEMAWASAGQSSPCRIVVSTPHGKTNTFARLRHESPIESLRIHWSKHPAKTQEWYEREKKRMTEDEIARELDINYHLSSRDRVFHEFTVKHKRELEWNQHQNVIRSWDFGYHCPAVLFIQIDTKGRMLVLHEVVGEREQLKIFAERVLEASSSLFPGANFEDYADPAGNQRSDKSELTSIEILNSMGIYPATHVHTIFDGLELLRMAFTDVIDDLPALLIHESCHKTIAALEGGYRYYPNSDRILEEHPYEDVMDCLRYAATHKLKILGKGTNRRRKARNYRKPIDPYTGY